MPTIWNERWIIIIEWNRIAAANGVYSGIDPDTGGSETFGKVRLSPTGEEPPTHTGTNTAATGAMTVGIKNAFERAPWATLYDVNELGWDFFEAWRNALADMGLQEIEPEDDLLEGVAVEAVAVAEAAPSAISRATGFVADAAKELWKRVSKNPADW